MDFTEGCYVDCEIKLAYFHSVLSYEYNLYCTLRQIYQSIKHILLILFRYRHAPKTPVKLAL